MLDIAAGIAATKASLELTTKIGDLITRPKIDVEDVQIKLREMLTHVVNAQVALGEALVEVVDLRQKLSALSETRDLEASLVYVENVYWKRLAEDTLDGPFCPECWHKPIHQLSRMRLMGEDNYPNKPDGSSTTRKRKYDCLLHGGKERNVVYLVPASFFAHVKNPWSPPPPAGGV